MYAIVKAGGHQEKVEVGDVILVNRLDAKKGDTVEFPVALVVDGDKVTVNAKDLANISVKAEVVNDEAKPEDQHHEVQEQDRRCSSQGPSPAADSRQDHGYRLIRVGLESRTERNRHGT